MKNTPPLAASSILQEALDLLLITAAGNPRGEAQDENGLTKTVAGLLDRGADVNAANSYGETALMLAAQDGHTETVAELLARGPNVNAATSNGSTALMFAARNGYTEIILALLSRDGVDWQIVQDQLSHPSLRDLNKEVSVLLAVALPEGELRNSIITSFNERNPNNAIQQENNNILGAGIEAYKNLKDLKSWHVRYLTDSKDVAEDEVEILADQRFFYLLNHQDARQEALARNDLVAGLVSKSESLADDFVRIASGIPKIKDQEALGAAEEIRPQDLGALGVVKEIIPQDLESLEVVSRLSPEDLHKLTTKIIDKSKAENDGIPTLQASSLVAMLRNFEIDQASASPATTMHRGSVEPIVTPQKGGGVALLVKPRSHGCFICLARNYPNILRSRVFEMRL